jgi:hypothetical protein
VWEGQVEEDRTSDLRRRERLRSVRWVIENVATIAAVIRDFLSR